MMRTRSSTAAVFFCGLLASSANAQTSCTKNVANADCTGWYDCVSGSLSSTARLCGAGTLFDENVGYCNFASAVDCGATSSGGGSGSGSNSTTVTVGDSCSGNVALDDCSGYYWCINGKVSSQTQSCTTGTLFDQSSGLCLWEADVSCNGTTTTSSTGSTNSTCSKNTPTSDCKGFQYCVHGSLLSTITPCPAGTLFDYNRGYCNYESDVDCSASLTSSSGANMPSCPSGFTGQVGALDCSGFYYCLQGKLQDAHFLPCSGDTVYDSSSQICTWNDNQVCTANGTLVEGNSTTGTGSGSTNNTLCLANTNGMLAAADCDGFYYCFYGSVLDTKIPCPAGTLFDQTSGICDYESSVTCMANMTYTPSGSSGSSSTPTSYAGYYFPDFHSSGDCKTGHESWMEQNGYASTWLFSTYDKCCERWGYALTASGCARR